MTLDLRARINVRIAKNEDVVSFPPFHHVTLRVQRVAPPKTKGVLTLTKEEWETQWAPRFLKDPDTVFGIYEDNPHAQWDLNVETPVWTRVNTPNIDKRGKWVIANTNGKICGHYILNVQPVDDLVRIGSNHSRQTFINLLSQLRAMQIEGEREQIMFNEVIDMVKGLKEYAGIVL